MAQPYRVFVKLLYNGDLSEGSIAFLYPSDTWESVLEALFMCFEEDCEANYEKSDIQSMVVLKYPAFEQIFSASEMEDSGQYILCRTIQESKDFCNAVRGISETHSSSDQEEKVQLGCLQEERSNKGTLEDLSYYFDEEGTLRHFPTNESVSSLMNDETKVDEIDQVLQASIFYIQMDMLAELDFVQIRVPLDPRPQELPQARCSVFVSRNWKSCTQLMIVINGSRGVQPGIWSRDLLIQEGLQQGSMIPVFQKMIQEEYGIVVLNPFTNNVTINNNTFPIRNSSSPEEHTLYVYDEIIQQSRAKDFFILGYSIGAKLTQCLLIKREEDVLKRLRGIAFVEAAYLLEANCSPNILAFLRNRVINFKGDPEIALGHRIPLLENKLGCVCVSVGKSAVTDPNKRSTNKARTISHVIDTVFDFFAAISRHGCSSKSYVTALIAALPSLAASPESAFRARLRSIFRTDTSISAMAKKNRPTETIQGRKLNTRKSDLAVDMNNFTLLKVIGKGSIGKVFMVRNVDDQKVYAMKVLKKADVVRHELKVHVQTERFILERIDHPFIAHLRYSFQTKDKLYLVTDFCSGGELFYYLKDGAFPTRRAQFYAAEIVLALEHLHSLDVVYRDLKPENLLLDADGHIKLTDFGLSKVGVNHNTGASTLVGSAEYLAPEIFSQSSYGNAVDWWSFGVLLYEMLVGKHPFFDSNQGTMTQHILTPNYISSVMPESVPCHAASLICGLVEYDPRKRMGYTSIQEIRDHPFFAGINWDKMMLRKVAPPWTPQVRRDSDVTNFDCAFTSQPAVDSIATQQSTILSATFDDFTYDSQVLLRDSCSEL